jgi:catechol 2,3-dioxygenase-like lactoylglutathione lyase family enzyme
MHEMNWTIEVVLIPVTDVDRAKAFYSEQLGFDVDVDHKASDAFRVVQLTPPGSSCSISLGVGITDAAPGSVRGVHLVVPDIEQAHAELVERGVDVSPIQHFEDGQLAPGPDPERRDFGTYVFFSDPDGNTWAIQEVPSRAAAPS